MLPGHNFLKNVYKLICVSIFLYLDTRRMNDELRKLRINTIRKYSQNFYSRIYFLRPFFCVRNSRVLKWLLTTTHVTSQFSSKNPIFGFKNLFYGKINKKPISSLFLP